MKKENSIQYKILKHSYHDKEVRDFYNKFRSKYKGFTPNHKISALLYIHRLNKAARRYQSLDSVPLPKLLRNQQNQTAKDNPLNYIGCVERKAPEELAAELLKYEVISFDIFDTLIFRKVAFPNDVFRIMANIIGHEDFVSVRKKAEGEARVKNMALKGCREVTLEEIYEILEKDYDIKKETLELEKKLEKELCTVNPYMKAVFDILLQNKKTIVLMSDMYLSADFISEILNNCGYSGWKKLYLSNELLCTKGEGSLQKVLLSDYSDLSPNQIIHIGDNFASDIQKSQGLGLSTYYSEKCELPFNEGNMENLAGSFYRSLMDRNLNCGLWDKDEFFTHGFRVGGLLAGGYCQFINRTARSVGAEKILFCARDCDVLFKIYNQFYKEIDSEYIYVSRYSLLNIDCERYLYDILNRIILRHFDSNKNNKTLEELFTETGYECLVPYLDESGFNSFDYCASTDKEKLREFILGHKNVIISATQKSRETAVEYFKGIIGNAKSILICDIGWSGSSISILRHFIHTFIDRNIKVQGTLLATGLNDNVTGTIESNVIYPWLYSAMHNIEYARFLFPAKVRGDKLDVLHMALEYLFTSTDKSTTSYNLNDGKVSFEKVQYEVPNKEEIASMQEGMIFFNREYSEFIKKYHFEIPSSIAFNVFKAAVSRADYLYRIYGNFLYDAAPAPFVKPELTYSDLLLKHTDAVTKAKEAQKLTEKNEYEKSQEDSKNTILFVSPELVYTGAPRSLLRMARGARELGYTPVCVSAKDGIFKKEFTESGIEVLIVAEKDIYKKEFVSLVKNASMAVVNTIVCSEYERMMSRYIPVVWYIREATNIPDFTRNNREREFVLRHSKNIVCVSDYAKDAIKKFTRNKIRVVKNCVEDETSLATGYIAGSGEKVKFVQFGTMEARKGYDILLSAYKSLPSEYKEKAELYFAGGFINSGSAFCSYLFSQMKGEPNVHYLGIVKGEKAKIETLSGMDVITVLSRDESCSLVALEGAMLSKPLFVTENVGAKYMVQGGNGLIVPTANVEETAKAMMYFIDHKAELSKMGKISRENYEKMAGMDFYMKSLKKLYSVSKKKNSLSFKIKRLSIKWNYSKLFHKMCTAKRLLLNAVKIYPSQKCVVSLTSHPGRIEFTGQTVKSLLAQKAKPKKIVLYLSKEQFPNEYDDLPGELCELYKKNASFEIRFVSDDLKPHKKYFYAAKEFPKLPVIIVDDDVTYDPLMVWTLMQSYKKHPHCISANRVNRITFDSNKNIRPYKFWQMNYTLLKDVPSDILLPTGVGGVLYPPGAIPEVAFESEAIKENCLYCDDLWLKILTMMNGYPSVLANNFTAYKEIPESQKTALWKLNVVQQNNDATLQKILNFCEDKFKNKEELLHKMLKAHFC